MSRITEFLAGEGLDASGRNHGEILHLSDASLESLHDFIQWLFPLPEASRAVPGSPILTEQDVTFLRQSVAVQSRARAGAERMLSFYRRSRHWLAPHDHNHLRISRIIRSLRLIMGDEDADGFHSVIVELVKTANAPVSALSLSHWNAA